jgi:hypothetical protein
LNKISFALEDLIRNEFDDISLFVLKGQEVHWIRNLKLMPPNILQECILLSFPVIKKNL